ncbi:MAG: putative zinc-binding metallopeptidase [Gammaproteobacteria bacterium]|jgi:hypothetical protein
MKTFRCTCGNQLFFENTRCLVCGKTLGYLPDQRVHSPLVPAGDELWTSALQGLEDRRYRKCANYTTQQVCNWMVPEDDPNPLCCSCRLSHIIPNLSQPGNLRLWHHIETAKRRLLYTLDGLGLPIEGKEVDPQHGLSFQFLESVDTSSEFTDAFSESSQVMTGHRAGTITINLAEADPSAREHIRERMNELYRTLLGHFRHESGHYYWYKLVESDSDRLAEFRDLFGDERQDYDEALSRYYGGGAPADWPAAYVSAYAAAHPWEDWAETWAHYLHLVDTLETAHDHQLALNGQSLRSLTNGIAGNEPMPDLEALLDDWRHLTTALNDLNRSMGLPDAYPFSLTGVAARKVGFVHRLIRDTGR